MTSEVIRVNVKPPCFRYLVTDDEGDLWGSYDQETWQRVEVEYATSSEDPQGNPYSTGEYQDKETEKGEEVQPDLPG